MDKKTEVKQRHAEVLKANTEIMKLHIRAMACHCETMGMMSENMLSACSGSQQVYDESNFMITMHKWGLVDREGKPIL